MPRRKKTSNGSRKVKDLSPRKLAGAKGESVKGGSTLEELVGTPRPAPSGELGKAFTLGLETSHHDAGSAIITNT